MPFDLTSHIKISHFALNLTFGHTPIFLTDSGCIMGLAWMTEGETWHVNLSCSCECVPLQYFLPVEFHTNPNVPYRYAS